MPSSELQTQPTFDPLQDILWLSLWLHNQHPDQAQLLISDVAALYDLLILPQDLSAHLFDNDTGLQPGGYLWLTETSPEALSADLKLPLSRNRVYLLQAKLRSSLPIKILDLQALGIADSSVSVREFSQTTDIVAVFAAPHTASGSLETFSLFDFTGSEIEDTGEISLLEFRLYEIDPMDLPSP